MLRFPVMSPRIFLIMVVLTMLTACGEEEMPIVDESSSSSSLSSLSISSSKTLVSSFPSSFASSSEEQVMSSQASSVLSSLPPPDRTSMMVEDYDAEGDIQADSGNAYGTVQTSWDGGVFSLLATVINLTPPPAGKQYIGWIMRAGPSAYIKTGPLEKVYGSFVNTFQGQDDLRAFTYYGVTLDDPSVTAPGQQVLWAKIEMKQ